MENEDAAECGSVTHWIRELKGGNQSAIERLWNRYYLSLSSKARTLFGKRSRAVQDEEDIAAAALDFLLSDKLHNINNRQELIKVLVTITRNKVCDHKRRTGALTRGGGRVSTICDLDVPLREHVENLQSKLDGPEIVAKVRDLYRHLKKSLPDEELQLICELRVNGAPIEEIAEKLGVAMRTVERRIKLIQTIWLETMQLDDIDPFSD